MCILYKLLYGFPYQDLKIANKNHLNLWENYYDKQIKKYIKSFILPESYNGKLLCNNKIVTSNQQKKIKIRALKHYKINQKAEKTTEYYMKLLEDTKANSQNIYFIIPPATNFYKSVLPKSAKLFKEIYKLCENYSHAKIINLYDSEEFTNNDFRDGDHLNNTGMIKFTKIIHKEIGYKI